MNLFTTISDWWKRVTYTEPDDVQLTNALRRLLADDQPTREQWTMIDLYLKKDNLGFSVSVGQIPGAAEAQTKVFSDRVEIVVDLNKIKRLNDSLEAVLGHEIRHAYEALEMGLAAYIDKVKGEGGKDWWHKEVEQSAISYEDQLRARLRATGKYNSISPTRAAQNRRAHI